MKKRRFIEKFDVALLDKLAADEDSCLHVHKSEHHVALHPYHLNDLNNSVKDVLNGVLAKYNAALEGIICGYKNIKLLSDLGKICDDSCFIHVDLEAEFFVFKPVVDKLLKGVVQKITKDHIGCLVHNVFNVSCPKPKKKSDWVGASLELGDEVQFSIKSTDFEGYLPYIKGEIVTVLSEKASKPKKIKFELDEEQEEPTEKRSKKKKKKSKHDDEDVEQSAENMLEQLLDSSDVKVKKKKKKEKSH